MHPGTTTPFIRLATKADQPQIIALIDGVYTEYGEIICLEDADKDLLDIDGYYFARGGSFWVLEQAGRIVGSHASHPVATSPKVCTFRRLYLAREWRGTEWGHRLMQVTIDWAREKDFPRIEFWSDTRFKRAHRFFEKFGFHKTGEVRDMHDGVLPYSEYFFFLDLPSPD
ncbi:MAG: GNAT family N-acetyltransferase [Pirellulaceae bacterium]